MLDLPEELKYSKEHLWVRIENQERAVIGLTDYAQKQLGLINTIDLSEVGEEIEQEDSFGSVEARKTIAELYAPVSGTVLEINRDVINSPEIINDDPYDNGWLAIIELADSEELRMLMSDSNYLDYIEDTENIDDTEE